MYIGFTGTRNGMTEKQKFVVENILRNIEFPITAVQHGDCVGADADFHAIARKLNLKVFIRPPKDEKLRAFCEADFSYIAEPYLTRNKLIVNSSILLIATPKENAPSFRGGTWYTVRYALKQEKKINIVFRDGHIKNC